MRFVRRRWWLIFPVLGLVMLAPLPVAALTESEVLGVLGAVIQGILTAGRDTYCALGVAALCP